MSTFIVPVFSNVCSIVPSKYAAIERFPVMLIFPLFTIFFTADDLFCEKIPIESSFEKSIFALFVTLEFLATIPFALLEVPVIFLPVTVASELSA